MKKIVVFGIFSNVLEIAAVVLKNITVECFLIYSVFSLALGLFNLFEGTILLYQLFRLKEFLIFTNFDLLNPR